MARPGVRTSDLHPRVSPAALNIRIGAIAQLGEHLLCKQGVVGSIPTGSTILALAMHWVCSSGG